MKFPLWKVIIQSCSKPPTCSRFYPHYSGINHYSSLLITTISHLSIHLMVIVKFRPRCRSGTLEPQLSPKAQPSAEVRGGALERSGTFGL
jgi:hypothetical protein